MCKDQVVKYDDVYGQMFIVQKVLRKREMATKYLWNKLSNARFWRKFG